MAVVAVGVGPFNLLDVFLAMNAAVFDREDLGATSDEDGPPTPACCSFTNINLRKMRDLDNDLGDGLYKLMEDAETVSKERNAEGYYLATCQHIKTLHEVRMKSLETVTNIVAHHNRTHMSCRSDVIRRSNEQLQRRLNDMELRNHQLDFDNAELRAQLRDVRESQQAAMESRMRCLKAQYESRYENQLKQHTELLEKLNATIASDTVEILTLRKELQEVRQKNKSSRNVIAFLNKRVRDVVKSIRKNKTDGGPKCAILGTYNDVLGIPV